MPRKKKTETTAEAVKVERKTGAGSQEMTIEAQRAREAATVHSRETDKPTGELPTLPPHQQYFEAPDGRIIVGQSKDSRMWDAVGNKGKGCWILPKR